MHHFWPTPENLLIWLLQRPIFVTTNSMLSRTKFNIFLVLLSTVVGLLLVEYALVPALLAVTHQPGRSLILLGVVGIPNALVDDTKINSQGFTVDVLSESKPPNTKGILTLGGSAIFNRRMTGRLIDNFSRATPTHLEIQGGALTDLYDARQRN